MYWRRQTDKSVCLERLRSYNAFAEWSMTSESQFPHHPELKFMILRVWNVNKTKFCLLESLLWPIIFVNFFAKQINLVRGIFWCFLLWKLFLWTDWVSQLLLYIEAGTRTNWFMSRQLIYKGWLTNFMVTEFSLDGSMSLYCFHVVQFRVSCLTSLRNLATWCLFMLCRFLLGRFIRCSQRNRLNSFGQRWSKWLSRLCEKDWSSRVVERFCVFTVERL